jgi:hypothetical protein
VGVLARHRRRRDVGVPAMIVEHGPPGHRGVTTLMSVSDAHEFATNAGWGAVAVWGYGLVTGNARIKRLGFTAALGAFVVQALTRK